jgi:tungstate transport system ATP-binding protein
MDIMICRALKKYGDKTALDIIDVRIKGGSLTGIIGPNGSGKTTLARIIGGLDDDFTGSVLYDGSPLMDMTQMTVVFQKPYMLRSTVFKNIAYPLVLRRVDAYETRRRVEEISDLLEIGHLLNRKAWTLSGGEAQKVALARAVVFKPGLLVLDEPTASIDPLSMVIMEKAIRSVREENHTTVVMVTHNVQQARRLCTDVIYLDGGRAEEWGSTDDVIFNSKNERTRQFISDEILI